MFLQTKNSKKIIAVAVLLMMAVNFGYVFHSSAAGASGSWDGPAVPPAPGSTGSDGNTMGPISTTIAKYAIQAFGAVGVLIMELVALLQALVGKVFDLVVKKNLSFNDNVSIITIGWKLARDVANMFFIFILLFISITTMLRVSGYETKVLLRRLIVIALLINFSLTFGLMIVDGTNVLGNEFYVKMQGNDTNASLSFKLIASAREQAAYVFQPTNRFSFSIMGIPSSLLTDLVVADTNGLQQAKTFAKLTWGNVIILSILLYVLAFASILLLIRVAVLSFLLVIMPLAFLASILPKTEGMWNEWWSSFLNHAFFFPINMFMMWFALQFANQFPRGENLSGNYMDNPALLMAYLVACVMLIGSLLVAKKLAIFGSGTVLKWASAGSSMIQGAIIGGAINQSIGRIGQKIQAAAPNSYLWSRVGGTMAGAGKMSPLGSRSQQTENEAKFKLAAAQKQSVKAQLGILKETKNPKLREGIVQGIMKSDKELSEVMSKGDKEEQKLFRDEAKLVGGVKAEKQVDKAIRQNDMKQSNGAPLTPADLGTLMESKSEDEQKLYFKAMNNQQQTDLLETWGKDANKIDNIQKMKDGLDFEEQEKFEQNLRRTSNTTIGTYMERLSVNGKTDEEQRLLGKLSPQQQVHLWDNVSQKGASAVQTFETKMGKAAADVQANYHKAFVPMLQSKSADETAKAFTHLPEEVKRSFASAAPEKVKAAWYSNLSSPEETQKMRDSIDKAVKDSGSEEKYTKSASRDAVLWAARLGVTPPAASAASTPPKKPPSGGGSGTPSSSGGGTIIVREDFGGNSRTEGKAGQTSGTSGQRPPKKTPPDDSTPPAAAPSAPLTPPPAPKHSGPVAMANKFDKDREEADVIKRNASWSENAKKVEAAKAEAVASSIKKGEYEYDQNVSNEENTKKLNESLKNLRAKDAEIIKRNEDFYKGNKSK